MQLEEMKELELSNQSLMGELEEKKSAETLLKDKLKFNEKKREALAKLLAEETESKKDMAQQISDGKMREGEYRRSIDYYNNEVNELRADLEAMDEIEETNVSLTSKLEDAVKTENMLNFKLEKKADVEEKLVQSEAAKKEADQKLEDGQMRENEYRRSIDYYSDEIDSLRKDVEGMGELKQTNQQLGEEIQSAKQVEASLRGALSKKKAVEQDFLDLRAEKAAVEQQVADGQLRENEYRRSIAYFENEIVKARTDLQGLNEITQEKEGMAIQLEEAKKVELQLSSLVKQKKAMEAEFDELKETKTEVEQKVADGKIREDEYRRSIGFYNGEIDTLRGQLDGM